MYDVLFLVDPLERTKSGANNCTADAYLSYTLRVSSLQRCLPDECRVLLYCKHHQQRQLVTSIDACQLFCLESRNISVPPCLCFAIKNKNTFYI